MAFERTPQNSPRGPYADREPDYSQNTGSNRDYTYSSARDYAASGMSDREMTSQDRSRGQYGQSGGQSQEYRGSYASDGHRFNEQDRDDRGQRDRGREQSFGNHSQSSHDRDYRQPEQGQRYQSQEREPQERYQQDRQSQGRQGQYGGRSQGYDYDDRGFVSRAGDEVRSWFGDSDAEQRREMDQRQTPGQSASSGSDDHYSSWRKRQMDELDRDYAEYRDENRSRFENEFSTFRTTRQTQRGCLDRVKEHMEVIGSDDQHVGTVDKVRGDRILLTKTDKDAGGHHHSIPSRWIDSVDDKVKIGKTADEAHKQWRDEERNQVMLGDDKTKTGAPAASQTDTPTGGQDADGPHILNRSFSGTY